MGNVVGWKKARPKCVLKISYMNPIDCLGPCLRCWILGIKCNNIPMKKVLILRIFWKTTSLCTNLFVSSNIVSIMYQFLQYSYQNIWNKFYLTASNNWYIKLLWYYKIKSIFQAFPPLHQHDGTLKRNVLNFNYSRNAISQYVLLFMNSHRVL